MMRLDFLARQGKGELWVRREGAEDDAALGWLVRGGEVKGLRGIAELEYE